MNHKMREKMKKNIYYIIVIFFVALLSNSCEKSAMEEAQDSYDYNAIVPVVLDGVQGITLINQTFTSDYTVDYCRGGSTWNWSVTDATIQSISDDTRTVTVLFSDLPDDGYATITVSETTMGGVTSESVSLDVMVNQYCPLSGLSDLVGSWSGTDGVYGDYESVYSSVITTEVSGEDLLIAGIGKPFMEDFWAETVTATGDVVITINEDGTITIPRQYIYTTSYEGSPYDYDIEGSGTWDNCGESPALIINYDIYYSNEEDELPDGVGIAGYYASYGLLDPAYIVAEISLDSGTETAQLIEEIAYKRSKAPFKNK